MQTTANLFYNLFQETNRDERRSSPRSSASDFTACRVTFDDESSLAGWVNDLSTQGVSIVSDEPVLPESDVEVTLFNASSTTFLRLSVRIVRCNSGPNGGFLLGGQFAEQVEYETLVPFLI